MKDLCNKSNEDVIKYLKSVDFVSEAQEFRIASIDGLVSFPVGCFYRSCKGGSNKIKTYDCRTKELLQACQNCILSSVMRKVIFTRNAAVLVTNQRKRYGENADFVNSMAFHSCVCRKSPGSLTLKLLRELTCRPFRSITRKYLFQILHPF